MLMLPGFNLDLIGSNLQSDDANDEGDVALAPVEAWRVRGYVAMVDFREVESGRQQGQQYDAVAGVPRTTPVRQGQLVTVPSAAGGILPGMYAVSAIRDTRVHLRVLMTRVQR